MAAGVGFSLVWTSDGIFTFGDNSCGQLGHGDFVCRHVPQKVSFFDGMTVRAVACGCYHVLVCCDEGLFAFGWGEYGQLGNSCFDNVNTPQKVLCFEGYESAVTRIACGFAHSFVLLNESDLYAFGDNQWGQLGIGAEAYSCTPTPVPLPETVTSITCLSSLYHTLVGSTDGVYACGHAGDAKLGGEEKKDRSTLHRVHLPAEGVRIVAAGSDASMAVTDSGAVYAWGCAADGKLGPPSEGECIGSTHWSAPTCVNIDGTSVVALVCGTQRVFVVVDTAKDEEAVSEAANPVQTEPYDNGEAECSYANENYDPYAEMQEGETAPDCSWAAEEY